MTSRRRDLGALSPRLLELSAKTTHVAPYPITDKLEIKQTRQRRDDLHASYTEIINCQQKLEALIRRVAAASVPELPADDADDDAIAAYDAELAAWTAQRELMERQADELKERLTTASDRYSRAFFGDVYDDVMELSADWPPEVWEAFKTDVNEHFQQGVNPPPDGTNDAGDIVDEAEAVEAGKLPT